MDLKEIIKTCESIDPNSLISVAKEKLKEIVDVIVTTGKNAGMDINGDFLAQVLLGAMVVDGDIDAKEYVAYQEMCDYAAIPPISLEDCYAWTKVSKQEIKDLFGQYKQVLFPILNAVGKYEDLGIVLICTMLSNGKIEEAEIEYLKLFMDGETTSTTNSNINSGSSSSSLDQFSNEEVAVKKHGYSLTRQDDGSYYLSVGAELFNPNVNQCASNVEVNIIVKDSSGRILENHNEYIDYIDSNAPFNFGTEFYIDRGSPANYTIQVHTGNFVKAPANSTFASGIKYSHYSVERNRWGGTNFSCNIFNGYNTKLDIRSYFVFYDKANNITGGICTYNNVYGNSDDGIDLSIDTEADRSSVRASASFDFMDLQ